LRLAVSNVYPFQSAELFDVGARNEIAEIKAQLDALKSGSSSGISKGMDSQAERDLTDAKIAAAEARTDTKFARFEGKIDLMLSQLGQVSTELGTLKADNKSTRTTVIVTAVSSTFAIITVLIAVMALGAAQFYNGTVIFDHIKAAQSAAPIAK